MDRQGLLESRTSRLRQIHEDPDITLQGTDFQGYMSHNFTSIHAIGQGNWKLSNTFSNAFGFQTKSSDDLS
jgi:hypothetical protein